MLQLLVFSIQYPRPHYLPLCLCRAWRGESVRRGVRERAALAGCGQAEDSGAGPSRRAPMRHLPPAPGQPRLRQQDLGQVRLVHVS